MNQTNTDIHNKVIVITGAAQGIGAATARLCAQRGAKVILVDVKQEQGEAVAADIGQSGGQAAFHRVDVRQETEVQALFEQVTTGYGRLDVLICAAGVLQGEYLQPEEFPLETFEFVMAVNVKGAFLCAKYATPLLAAQQGVMILIASGAGVVGGSSSIAYGTSKGAVNGLGMTLAGHLAPRGIRVNVVCPGNIETEMKLNVIRTATQQQGQDYQTVVSNSNLGEPLGVARLLAYLASDEADYVRRTLFTR